MHLFLDLIRLRIEADGIEKICRRAAEIRGSRGGAMDNQDGSNDIENIEGTWREMERNASGFYENENDAGSVRQPLLRKRTMNTTSQIAIVGANVCPIESLDYEIVENDLFKQDWRSRKKIQIFQYVLLKWALALLIGLATGVVGFFNNLAVENIAGFKLLLTSNLMLEHRYFTAFLAYGGINLILAAAAAALCAYIAPAAAGSGIPEVKAYLNGVDAYSILAPSTLFVKIFGSIGGVSAGFVLGKEGPMVHTGACIANLLGQGGSRKYHLTWTWLRYFKSDRDRRDLITCGSAAGVAAAFRAPVGGVLFALEEAASWWRSALLWRTFFTTAIVAVVLRGLIEYCRSGKCGLFGKGGLIMFDISSNVSTYSTPDLIAVIVLGIIGGVFGALFNYLLDRILRTYSFINEKGAPYKILLTITISILTSCCSYGLPWLAKCTPCPKDLEEECPTVGRSGNFKNFHCPPGYYNDLASLFLNTNDDAIRNLFSGGTVLLISKTVADCFNKGVYDQIVMMKGLPYMEAHAEPYMRHLVAGDVVSGPLITFSGVEKVGNIVQALRLTGHNGFPVIDEPPFSDAPELFGLVLRSHLLVLLKGKRFTRERVKTGVKEILQRFGAFDFAKAGSGKGLKFEDLNILEEEMDMFVDLHPITNTSPYTVVETMSLAKAAVLFRELGLRHLCVVPKTPGRPPIVGILTRHDFTPEHILGLFPHIHPHK
ncbi:Chloride channel protein [Musa troglodytarum]|uniref:Chloride channel protein n=1 Tax=Musa troglodytarum TaxID=320322 RepID=A0A9E7K9Z3_9LILI|nr:Chloride channel protein [Musa troglodytarum]